MGSEMCIRDRKLTVAREEPYLVHHVGTVQLGLHHLPFAEQLPDAVYRDIAGKSARTGKTEHPDGGTLPVSAGAYTGHGVGTLEARSSEPFIECWHHGCHSLAPLSELATSCRPGRRKTKLSDNADAIGVELAFGDPTFGKAKDGDTLPAQIVAGPRYASAGRF